MRFSSSSSLHSSIFHIFFSLCVVLLNFGCDDEPSVASTFDVLIKTNVELGNAPLKVEFTTEKNGPLSGEYTWEWDFGNEQKSEEESPTYTFDEPGTYTVKVVVIEQQSGSTGSAETVIEVVAEASLSVSDVNFAPTLSRCNMATFSSKCLGKT